MQAACLHVGALLRLHNCRGCISACSMNVVLVGRPLVRVVTPRNISDDLMRNSMIELDQLFVFGSVPQPIAFIDCKAAATKLGVQCSKLTSKSTAFRGLRW